MLRQGYPPRNTAQQEELRNKIRSLVTTATHTTLARWAAECAERILHVFEDLHPEDNRPRKAITTARAWIQGKISAASARAAAGEAHAAARTTQNRQATCAARAAGHAAAVAHTASHALHAADYAAKASSDQLLWQYEALLSLCELDSSLADTRKIDNQWSAEK
jgi:hypothetical protein